MKETQKAEKCLKKAVKLEADFFWYPYSLGMIYARQGRYEEALVAFKHALKTSPQNTLYLMHAYKAYNMLMPEVLKKEYNPERALLNAIHLAQDMLITCQYRLPVSLKDSRVYPKMF